jgi:hypothetical protein
VAIIEWRWTTAEIWLVYVVLSMDSTGSTCPLKKYKVIATYLVILAIQTTSMDSQVF